jgi:hypothetical protein
MKSICIRMEEQDVEELKKMADGLRIPYTIVARMMIMRCLKPSATWQEELECNMVKVG